ncbi:cytochrome P450 [Actinomadura vinacea]|uniref:Cytochrome P450 n=1 Tax=Actinomadura vinacea TaxID=115336 RepID=A0ABN3K4U5_9ACTN
MKLLTDEQLWHYFSGMWAGFEEPDHAMRVLDEGDARPEAECRPLVRATLPNYTSAWLVTGYRECVSLLSDPVFRRCPSEHQETSGPASPIGELLSGIDPPRHTRLRGLVARAFAARKVETMRPVLERRVARHLAAVDLESGTTVDLYRRFCLPLASETTFAITGFPAEFHAATSAWAHKVLVQSDFSTPEFARLAREQVDLVEAIIAAKRRSPGSDVLTDLIGFCDRDGLITEAELRAMVASLPVSGHVKGAMQLAAMLLILLNRPNDLERLRREPSLIPTALQEMLRYAPVPAHLLPRFPARDLEFGGTVVKAGEALFPAVFAANHDPAVFDTPHRLDLRRKGERPLTFGHGAHFCLGTHLMQLMMTIALEQVLEPLAACHAGAPADHADWITGGTAHGVVGLTATLP